VDFPVTDVLQMMGRAGRPQFDETGVACIFVHEPKKNFYRKFLHEPFPVESSLHLQLHEHINAEVAANALHDTRGGIEYLTWTYYFRRLVMNPAYYGLEDPSSAGIERHLSELINGIFLDLAAAGCLEISDDDGGGSSNKTVRGTSLGFIASYYYLHCSTVGLFQRRLEAMEAKVGAGPSQLAVELLQLIADAAEFAELPVRHNEEMLNNELAADVASQM
jgi:activating signal cointegrator complex subunit 3